MNNLVVNEWTACKCGCAQPKALPEGFTRGQQQLKLHSTHQHMHTKSVLCSQWACPPAPPLAVGAELWGREERLTWQLSRPIRVHQALPHVNWCGCSRHPIVGMSHCRFPVSLTHTHTTEVSHGSFFYSVDQLQTLQKNCGSRTVEMTMKHVHSTLFLKGMQMCGRLACD